MNLEDRLRNLIQEQTQPLQFEPGDPNDFRISRSTNRVVLTGVTALVVVALAGFAFFSFTAGGLNDGQVTEAADDGETPGPNDGLQGEADEDSPARSDVAVASLTFTPIDGEDGPGPWSQSAQVASGNSYYVLSTAPGKVDVSDPTLNEEEQMKLFRPNTVYHFNKDSGWNSTTIEDRFISSLSEDSGVLYLLSTGTPTGGTQMAVGSSADNGQSWTWSDITGFPEDKRKNIPIGLASANGQQFVIASHGPAPDWDEALAVIGGSAYATSENNVANIDHQGFSIFDTPAPVSECQVLLERESAFATQIDDEMSTAYEAEGDDFDPEVIFDQYRSELVDLGKEINAQDCYGPALCGFARPGTVTDWPTFAYEELENAEGNETAAEDAEVVSNEEWSGDEVKEHDCTDPTTIAWDEIGFTPPPSWEPWGELFRIDDGALTPLGLPFEPSYIDISSNSGQIHLTTWPIGEFGNDDEDLAPRKWSSPNGTSWTSARTSNNGWFPPIVGDTTFRVNYGDDAASITIERSVADGPWTEFPLSEITGTEGPAIEDEGTFVEFVGINGAVLATVHGRPSDAADKSYFTVDGMTWQFVPVEGTPSPVVVGPRGSIVSFFEGQSFDPNADPDSIVRDDAACADDNCNSEPRYTMLLVERSSG